MQVINVEPNCVSPWDAKLPHEPQQRFLKAHEDHKAGKLRSHFIAGRGAGKTLCGILLLLYAVMRNPGKATMWTEPTTNLLDKIFFVKLKELVPNPGERLYKINYSKREVYWANGHTTFAITRNSDNPSKETAKGIEVIGGIEDEIAYKFDEQKYWDVDGCIRGAPGEPLFHACLTTPKLNRYHDIVHAEGHLQINAKSQDNPHIDRAATDDLAGQMSARRMAQEILGEWVPQGYFMWPEWSDDTWPDGNMIDYEHNHNRPWYLAFDIGAATGAYLAIQPFNVQISSWGKRNVAWVVTHEWMPRRDGTLDRIFPMIKEALGKKPYMIAVGADVNTRSNTTGDTAQQLINRHFGAVPTRDVTGWHARKDTQEIALNEYICNVQGERRFLVSKNLKSYPAQIDEKHSRGILDAMHKDHWPDENEQRAWRNIWDSVKGSQFPTEHVRDAAMYAAVEFMNPPSMGHSLTHAR